MLTSAYSNPEDFMPLALAEAKEGDVPSDAVIVKDNEVMDVAHNTVRRDNASLTHA